MHEIQDAIQKAICEGKELDDEIEVSDIEEFNQASVKKQKI